MTDDRRLIEDYLPIQAISAEASREKSVRKGHISTLHLWWARRPLVACRAAVYGALVPASRFIPPACRDEERGAGRENGLHSNGKSLGRANAAKFIKRLCRYPTNSKPEEKADIERAIKDAQKHILEAHAERLTRETCLRAGTHRQASKKVTVKDIEEGRAPRPKVLDMFAGGGAIPLEALRLGCEAYALDLNPVAHIIELCTLVYPQKYGKPDPNARGMTGPPAPQRYWVYVIRCNDESFYIGQTDNLVRRYEDHCSGKVEWTSTHKPIELIHWEEFKTREEAVAREQELKTGFGRKWLKREWDAGRLALRQAGPKNDKGLPASLEGLAQPGETTWGGLAEEVRYWGNWVLKKVKAEIVDLYPLIPDPEAKKHGGTGFQPVEQNLFKTRRNLPHWQMGGSTYFVTFRTNALELGPEARTIVLDACRHFDEIRYKLWSVVVMPDHVHLLLQPSEIEKGRWHSLSSILHSIKSFTANKINVFMNRKGSVWQDESFDRIVRDEGEFYEKWNYIRNNPVKNGLADSPENWTGFYENTGKMPVPPDSSWEEVPPGYLVPVAYLWTRTVRCKNPSCGATVPLVKQTWLCKKKGGKKSPGRYVALKVIAPKGEKKVRFEVVEAMTEKGLGFDPSIGSKGGNATCPFCGTVADATYVQRLGKEKSVGMDLMAVVCTHPNSKRKTYISSCEIPQTLLPDAKAIRVRLEEVCKQTGLTKPYEKINDLRPSPNARGLSAVTRHGIDTFGDLFTDRQLLCLMTFCKVLQQEPWNDSTDAIASKAVTTLLAGLVDKIADYGSTFCRWISQTEAVADTFARHALAMMWDFAELCPFGFTGSNAQSILNSQMDAIESIDISTRAAHVKRGTSTALPSEFRQFDAVITDPPYYDNVPYADVSDFFYIWLKRSLGRVYPEHLSSELTPKKSEATALSSRHAGNMTKANSTYEKMMFESFRQAWNNLKANGQLVVVYAHKTTLGWATLVDALRKASFTVVEAWPLDTERSARLLAINTASLASSIFLVARKREGNETGSYEDEVQSELDHIIRERVDTLWKMGITGADLVIAAVGAGLRAFTRFARVEYANGEEVPAEKFLAEVEGVVLETLLEKIFVGQAGSLSHGDGRGRGHRFYLRPERGAGPACRARHLSACGHAQAGGAGRRAEGPYNWT